MGRVARARRQRWLGRAVASEKEAAGAGAAEEEEEEDEDNSDNLKSSSSSSEEEGPEEVEADQGVAHAEQLTNPAQINRVIMSIEYCQNTAALQQMDIERARQAEALVKAQTKVLKR
jgi:hypothetical protein